MPDIKQLKVKIGKDLSELDEGMRELNTKLDTAKARVHKDYSELSASMGKMGSALTMGLTLPIAATGAASAKLAMNFETATAKLEGLAGAGASIMPELRKQLEEMAPAVGKSAEELAQGMYFVYSSGIRGKEALDVLRASAKAATAGLGEVRDVADAVTSAVNSYGSANMPASRATDILVAAVREGKVEATEFAAAIGRVLPIAAAMNVSFANIAAGMATMTRSGLNADEAATSLRQTLATLLKPTKQTEDALNSVGLSSEQVRRELSENLITGLQHLVTAFNGNDEALAKVFPNIRSLIGVLNMTGQSAGKTKEIFDNVQNSTGATDKAFDAMAKTLGFKTKQSLIDLGNAGVKIGNDLTPALKDVAGVVSVLAHAFDMLPRPMRGVIEVEAVLIALLGPGLSLASKGVGIWGALANAKGLLTIAQKLENKTLEENAVATLTANEQKTAEALLNKEIFASATAAARGEQALAGAEVEAGLAAEGAAAKMGLLARARAGLSGLSVLGSPIVAIPAAVGAAFGTAIVYENHQRQKYLDATAKGDQEILAHAKTSYEAMSAGKLQVLLSAAERDRSNADAMLHKVKDQPWYSTWMPGINMGRGPMAGQIEADWGNQYNNANQRVLAIKAALEKQAPAAAAAAETAKQLSDDQKKATEENDKANIDATRNLYILHGKTETERELRQAWVDLTNEKDKILTHATEVKDKLGLTLDVTAQIKTAEAAYSAKKKEINDQSRQTAEDEATSAAIAELSLQALQTHNQYEQERLRAEVELTRTLHDLTNAKASQSEIALANAEYQQKINDIDKQQAQSNIADWIDHQRADATRTGNGIRLKGLDALASFTDAYASGLQDYEKTGHTGKIDKAWADYTKALADDQKEASQKAADALEKEAKASNDVLVRKYAAMADSAIIEGDLNGNSLAGKLKALDLNRSAQILQSDLAMATAKTADEKGLITAENRRDELKYQKDILDARVGGLDSFMGKVKDWKDEQIRAWDEMTEAATRYYDNIRNSFQFTTLDQMWEQATIAGARSNVPLPPISPRPSSDITANDVARFYPEMMKTQSETNARLGQVADTLGKLINGGSRL